VIPASELPEGNGEPELFNAHDEIFAEPHISGFQIPVARIFE
jgi:hypothetical protein